MQVEVGGLKVYYEQAGTGEPLLLLHGWGSSSEAFKPLMMRMAKSRAVKAIDFPGFGNSPNPPDSWSTQDYADLVADLLDAWGTDSADVMAHSFGARVALRLAVSRPEKIKKLLLTGAAGIRKEGGKVPQAKKILGRIAKIAGNFGKFGSVVKEKIYARIGSADYLAAGAMRPVFVRVVNDDLSGILSEVKHETLLVWGDVDKETPLQMGRVMDDGLKNSKLEIIDGAGHYAFIDKPQEFYDLTARFFGMEQ